MHAGPSSRSTNIVCTVATQALVCKISVWEHLQGSFDSTYLPEDKAAVRANTNRTKLQTLLVQYSLGHNSYAIHSLFWFVL